MATTPIALFYKNGMPAVIGQLVNGKQAGLWKGYYDNGQLMWEAENGFFSDGGVFWRMREQFEEFCSDLADDETQDQALMPYTDERRQLSSPVRLVNFWDEEGNHQVMNGTGQLRHRCARTLEIDQEMKRLFSDVEPGALTESLDPALIAGYKSYHIGFENGLYHGAYREFVDGKLTAEVYYNRGERHGIERWWMENGNLISLERWEHGKRTGMSFSWNFDGSWESVRVFKDGDERYLAAWDKEGKRTLSNGRGYTHDDYEIAIFFDGEIVAFERTWDKSDAELLYTWVNNITIPYIPR